ncbi:hypothetical protein ALO92_101497 [Pseudomonas congelans]|uniref:Uncharacterized protein n=1 Tax=Pseudomonas congelans TaxID=200452 RepID=A0A0P9RH28_9PSED|nr:hypothetical protein ALO92_101497 [Pseudomonas congelans]PBP95778.1 hypothetical protein CCL24_18205 [Pseudomonas congelans]PBQ01640.1 hypothetical protein CCL17_13615 [Pseudomonas congelans]PBQ06655.1 hypothetical protein CCL07_11255 [Pseudomonas congelans]PBQ15487.1 hypothetical protein CCL09_18710 [Pseudomonas congelans]
MERSDGHMSTIAVHWLHDGPCQVVQNQPKGLYSMNIREMASFLLSGL